MAHTAFPKGQGQAECGSAEMDAIARDFRRFRMPDDPDDFSDLIRRVRQGEAAAAEELVRHYEPMIRRRVRAWLRFRNPELRRTFDSMDICQSVLANFFVRVAAGEYDLRQPAHVVNLLTVMARNRLSAEVRYQQSQRRDIRRTRPITHKAMADLVQGETPSRAAAAHELYLRFRVGLTAEERQLADLRSAGGDWASIAAAVGGTPESCRKRWARAITRLTRELGLDGDVAVAP